MPRWLEWMIDQPIARYVEAVLIRAEKEERRAQVAEVQCAAPGRSNMFRPTRRRHKACSDTCRKALLRSKPATIQHHA
jgi:hypothetical protein